jgi:hypothetical protein
LTAAYLLMQLPGVGALADETSVMRGRNEGTATIAAANVAGNGNLTLLADMSGGARHAPQAGQIDLGAGLGLGGSIGVAEIMQLTARFTLEDFARPGPAEAHLQITTPRNDRLRFIGLALCGDLYLATSLDTISTTADAGKPLYNPELFGSVLLDMDWLAVHQRIPLKTYLTAGLVDEPQLLYRYNQLAFTGGIEWKGYRHSLFVEGGAAFYKEKGHRLNGNTPDGGYEQMYAWVRPGARYRLGNRFSLVGAVGVTLVRKTKPADPLVPRLFSMTVRFEAPLMFRETNTEAIRTLVFVERGKEQLKERGLARDGEAGARTPLAGQMEVLEGLGEGSESFDYAHEQEELRKRREETRKKMEEIEALLNEIEE